MRVPFLLTIIILAHITANALAVTRTWQGVSTNWNDTANWTGSTVPTNGDAVVIPATAKKPTMPSGAYPLSGLYLSFTLNNAATVTCHGATNVINAASGGTAAKPHGQGVTIRCGTATIDGVLSADQQGFKVTTGAGYKGPGFDNYYATRHGGLTLRPGRGGSTYGSLKQPTALGGSGYHQSDGGGAIKLDVTGTLTLNGRITANGGIQPGTDTGAGGSIWLICDTLAGSGQIRAEAGRIASTAEGRHSSGGRISIESATWSFTGSISAAGGADRIETQPGTLWAPALFAASIQNASLSDNYHYYFPSTVSAQRWSLVSTNGAVNFFSGFTNATWSITNLYVANNSTVRFDVDFAGATNKMLQNALFVTNPITVLNGSSVVLFDGTTRSPVLTVSNSTLNFGPLMTVAGVSAIRMGPNSSLFLPEGTYALTGDLNVPATATLFCRGRTNAVNAASGGTAAKPHGAGPQFSCQNATVGGTLTAYGLGFPGDAVGYRGPISASYLGGTHGGVGAYSGTALAPASALYGVMNQPTALGSGDYNAAPGGGAVKLTATGQIALNGVISANGVPTSSAGGAGGSVWLICDRLEGGGAISATGGGCTLTDQHRQGGGGRIAVECNVNAFTGVIKAGGGSGGKWYAQPGTVWFPRWFDSRHGTRTTPETLALYGSDNGFRHWFADPAVTNWWNLRITNSWLEIYAGSVNVSNLLMRTGVFREDAAKMSNLIVRGSMALTNSTLYLPSNGRFDMTGDLLVDTSTVIYALSDFTAVNADSGGATNSRHGAGLSIACRDATIRGKIDARGLGFDGALDPGPDGPGSRGIVLGGGGYGGQGGGWFQGTPNRMCYGSLTRPTALGSGGYAYSDGGGAVKLRASGTLTVEGTIDARGLQSTESGSGGSVWLQAGTLAGNGSILVDGPASTSALGRYGGGGGGRLAIEYGTWNYTGAYSVNGGDTLYVGEPDGRTGTVFLCQSPWLGTTSSNGVNDLWVDSRFSVQSNDVRIARSIAQWNKTYRWTDSSMDVKGAVTRANRATYTCHGLRMRSYFVYTNGLPLFGGMPVSAGSNGVFSFSVNITAPTLVSVELYPIRGTYVGIR